MQAKTPLAQIQRVSLSLRQRRRCSWSVLGQTTLQHSGSADKTGAEKEQG
jgi:hypothetical protein